MTWIDRGRSPAQRRLDLAVKELVAAAGGEAPAARKILNVLALIDVERARKVERHFEAMH